MKEVIRLDNIRRDFVVGDEVVHALRGISLTITEGEFVTIMGTSGSGKSTLLNTLGCLDTPTSGEYYLDGIAVRSMDKNARATLRNRKIGFVFQNYNLLAKTTALENVELPLMYNSTYPPRSDGNEPNRRFATSVWATACCIRATRCRAARCNAWRSRGHWSTTPPSSSRTKRRATSTPAPASKCWCSSSSSTPRAASIIFVTHNPEIARYSSRNVTLRDGHIISDVRNEEILSAAEALAKLPATDD